MPYVPSQSAKRILALIQNSKDLSVTKRTMASDVIEACKIFAKSKDFNVDHDTFDMLIYAIKNKQTQSLNEEFCRAEEEIVKYDMLKK